MLSELDILRQVSERLESAQLAFMLTGSLAMNYYAQPRMTRDIDLVVALKETDADTVVSLFERDCYIDRQAVLSAIARGSIFNFIHQDSVIKVDCIVLKNDPYRQEEFSRRRHVTIGDFQTWIVSLEDLNPGAAGGKMNDTPKEIAELMRGKLLARSGAERLLMGSRMFDSARAIVLASFPPGISEIEVKRRLCERLYGNEVDVNAFVESLRRNSFEHDQRGRSRRT